MMYVADLFSGVGGFSLGLEWTKGFKTVLFCENDKSCHKVLKKHWPDIPIYDDIKEVTIEKIKKDKISKIDIVTGGFPCQDISQAGKREGIKASRSGLWSEMCRLIGEIRPKYAIVENVQALLYRGLESILGDLAEIGYDAEWHCIPASAIGAPHQRDRVWIITYPKSGRRNVDAIQKRNNNKNLCWKKQTIIFSSDVSILLNRLKQGTKGFRGDDGLFTKLDKDRVRQLGNAVVPQIPYLIGMSILEYEKEKT